MKLAVPLVCLLGATACHDAPASTPELGPSRAASPASAVQDAAAEAPSVNPRLLRRFRPVTAARQTATPQVTLGRMLYFDPRLSRSGDVSCNSCHPLDRYGTDQRPTSIGHLGAVGSRNAPTVYHAGEQLAQFWDGRSPDLVDQAGVPITSPKEMGMRSQRDVVTVLRRIPGYVDAFTAAYPDDPEPISFANVTGAIAAFERGLLTPARWDSFLAGDQRALTAEEIEGFKVFSDLGCVECHTGQLVGGSMFQKAGRAKPWPTDTDDDGRLAVTLRAEDHMVFKVPTLRNVTETAPYFHDGSVATLREAIHMMAEYQLDVQLTEAEIDAIIGWLGTLTGELPHWYIAPPALPPDA